MKLKIEMFHPFGCEAWVHVPKAHKKKFDVTAKRMIFLGFQLQHQAYCLLDIETNRIVTSREVRFCITIIPKKEKPSTEEKNTSYVSIHDDSDTNSDEDGSSSAGETTETQDPSLKLADENSLKILYLHLHPLHYFPVCLKSLLDMKVFHIT